MGISYVAPSGDLSADGIRATVTGTPGAGKPIVDDNAGGLEWGTPGGSPAIADITDWPSGLSATELGYVNGVTSAIQTQLDAKLGGFSGVGCGKTSNQNLSSNSTADLTWTTQNIAPTSHVSHSTGASPANVTINTAGKYKISGVVGLAASGSNDTVYKKIYCEIVKNSTVLARFEANVYFNSGSILLTPPIPIHWSGSLAASDVIKLQVITPTTTATYAVAGQNSGADQTVVTIEFMGA